MIARQLFSKSLVANVRSTALLSPIRHYAVSSGFSSAPMLHNMAVSGHTILTTGIISPFRNIVVESILAGILFIKRTFQPSLLRRKRKHGFLARKATKDGFNVLKRRIAKGRRRLCA